MFRLSLYTLFTVILIGITAPVFAQQADTTGVPPDTSLAKTASLNKAAPQDTISAPASGLPAPSSLSALGEGVVYFQAKDSLIFNFRKDRVATLYGSAKVMHQAGKLEAGEVKLNLDKHIVSAFTLTPQDTLTQPVLTRPGKDPLRSKSITFNYKTKKGRFKLARIKIPKGKITGTVVKKAAPHVIFIKDAIFSTCPLPHPHYYIKADRAKIVNGEEIFFEDARLYILDIPYPIVFPFGYLPSSLERRQSGLLQPTYVFQNAGSRGLGLRNLGWFQYFNDYLTGKIALDIFTSGTFYLDATLNYVVRNEFNGGIQIGYSRESGLEPTDPKAGVRVEKYLSISHNQKFSPYSSISVSINLRTEDFFARNSYNIDERVSTSTNSYINYSYQHPSNLFTFNASIRQSHNFLNNITTITGPSFNFNLRRLTPFSDESTGSRDRQWYENISIQYQNSFASRFRYEPIRADSAQISWFQALLNPAKYRKATDNNKHYRFGFKQDISISFGNLWPGQYINLTLGGNYTEFWYPATIRKEFLPDSNKVVTHKVRGFAAAREYSANLSMSTTIYGISTTDIGNITGFRHVIRPSISFSYRPDFSSEAFGYFRTVQVDSAGHTRRYSIFENTVFGGPTGGKQMAINLSISNSLEAKVVKRDSTGEKTEHIISIIDRLSFSTGYNFAADSLNLRNLNVSFTSSIIEGVHIRASANFNFYERNKNGIKINEYLFLNGGFMELVNFSISASTRFSGGEGSIKMHQEPFFPANYNPLNQSIFEPMDARFNMRPVQPLNSPWSIAINFRYSWRLNPGGEPIQTATINVQQIRFHLTPKWTFSTRFGYDFIRGEFTPSKFRLTRQLHMWNLSFEMSPFGEFQYYFFKLSINSAALQSIFQKLPLLKNLERSSSPTGAGIVSYR